MITYKDIKRSVNQKLSTFGIEINSNDVQEGFNRPSFFVQLENNVRSGDENQVHKALTVQIYYFPKDRYDYSIEVMDVQDQLENKFDLKLKVLDRFFNIDEVTSDTTDGVLSFSFDLAFYDGKEISFDSGYVDENGNPIQIELMQTLDIKKG
ncbi:phage tail terminator family protein [Peribacillus loiseleuriae]|uniref:phage tail terminator family protein n=1 Tax=Peribacillus loiseleuriae TaxID=1679170 RepID=UPI003D0205B1